MISNRWTRRALNALLPSFIVERLHPERKRHKTLHATSYIDGLRGLAALIVFAYHYTLDSHEYFLPWYFIAGDACFLQLPYVRLIYSGKPMAHVFFVISGFALSYRPLKELHGNRTVKCHSILASRVLRRPFRLLAPCFIVTVFILCWSRSGYALRNYVKYYPTMWDQICHWAEDFFYRLAWPWSWESNDWVPSRYDKHLWTIHIELTYSYLLFGVVLLLSQLRLRLRVPVTLIIMFYVMICGRWQAFEFIGGCLLAELQLWKETDCAPFRILEDLLSAPSLRILDTLGPTLILLMSGLVLSWPSEELAVGMYHHFVKYTPRSFNDYNAHEFWFALAAVLGLWGIGHVHLLRRGLECRFLQYMGSISFAFYILQCPYLHLAQAGVVGVEPRPANHDWDGQPVEPGWGLRRWPGNSTTSQRLLSWVIGLVILVTFEIWIADLFTTYIDNPCVRNIRRMEIWACTDIEFEGNGKEKDDRNDHDAEGECIEWAVESDSEAGAVELGVLSNS